MRRLFAVLAITGASMAATGEVALAATRHAHPAANRKTAAAQRALRRALAQGMQQAGGSGGAYVVDLTTGQTLFSASAGVGRLPASVEKLYTTFTALHRFGAAAALRTAVLATGYEGPYGGWHGTLYLKGGGDPTFGSAAFDSYAYGTGATVEQLAQLVRAAGITSVRGRILGDESYFDSLRGTIESGYQFDPYMEGSLSALAFNRGLVGGGSGYVTHPATYAAQQLASALRDAGVKVFPNTKIGAHVTPAGARPIAAVSSPPIATLIALTNTPSDNFFAETLLKGIGARFGGAGTTAAGAAVVRSQLKSSFGIQPQLDDGSGLSRDDVTSPRDVVRLLARLAHTSAFVSSLAVAGETGTLASEMQGTAAQGRCRGKTGTLHDVANLAGYCHARDGHTLAFAFLMNDVSDPNYVHDPVEANMTVALAKYNG